MAHRGLKSLRLPRRYWPFAVGVIGLASVSCAIHPDSSRISRSAPDWVEDPDAGLSRGRLVGVGSGPTRSAAIDHAFMRLAQAIDVRVIADERVMTRGYVEQSDVDQRAGASTDLHRDVRLLAEERFPGVEIEQTWLDPKRGVWFARLTLDRAEAAGILDQEVEAGVARIMFEADQLPNGSRLTRVRLLRDIIHQMNGLIEVAAARDSIAGSPFGRTTLASLQAMQSELEADWNASRSDIRIAVQWTTPEAADIGRLVSMQVSDLGVLTLLGDADLIIRCALTLDTGGAFDGRTRATRWVASLDAIDPEARHIIVQESAQGAAVSRDSSAELARSQAQASVESTLPAFFDRLLLLAK